VPHVLRRLKFYQSHLIGPNLEWKLSHSYKTASALSYLSKLYYLIFIKAEKLFDVIQWSTIDIESATTYCAKGVVTERLRKEFLEQYAIEDCNFEPPLVYRFPLPSFEEWVYCSLLGCYHDRCMGR